MPPRKKIQFWNGDKCHFTQYSSEAVRAWIGAVLVHEEGGPVEFGGGDLVTFPKGMQCIWRIRADVRKHYAFG